MFSYVCYSFQSLESETRKCFLENLSKIEFLRKIKSCTISTSLVCSLFRNVHFNLSLRKHLVWSYHHVFHSGHVFIFNQLWPISFISSLLPCEGAAAHSNWWLGPSTLVSCFTWEKLHSATKICIIKLSISVLCSKDYVSKRWNNEATKRYNYFLTMAVWTIVAGGTYSSTNEEDVNRKSC